jgi:SAM-dependent methyltransferase
VKKKDKSSMSDQQMLLPINRNSKLLSHIQPKHQDGIEVGPLSTPIITKEQSNGHVFYVDYATTEELREKYKNDPNININDICEVDFIWGESTFSEIVKGREFDYLVASHVVEHVPDMIGWLHEIGIVLKDGGVLSLAIPDKRFTFDHLRESSSPGTLIEAYLLKKRRPGPREIFDHLVLFNNINAEEVWGNQMSNRKIEPEKDTCLAALAFAKDSIETDHYHGVHVNVFTPVNFLDLLEIIIKLNLFDYKIIDFFETDQNSNEFFASFQRSPRLYDQTELISEQLQSIDWARSRIQRERDPSEKSIVNKKLVTAEIEQQVDELQQQLVEQQHLANELQQRWVSLEQTRTWKLLTTLYRLRKFGKRR